MNWASITLLTLQFGSLLFIAYKHNKPSSDHNIWASLFATAVSATLIYFSGGYQ